MHELGIATAILDRVRVESESRGLKAVEVGVVVGELSGVNPESLAFGFEALTAGTEWQGLRLRIDRKLREHQCELCGVAFDVRECDCRCPVCGDARTTLIGGNELQVAYVDLEDCGASRSSE